jgi:hypothetical protein
VDAGHGASRGLLHMGVYPQLWCFPSLLPVGSRSFPVRHLLGRVRASAFFLIFFVGTFSGAPWDADFFFSHNLLQRHVLAAGRGVYDLTRH